MPSEIDIEQSADQRADHLRDHHHSGDKADHAAELLAGVNVADDRAAHHHAAGRSKGLKEASYDKLGKRVRENAHDRRGDGQRHAAEQNGAPAIPVR